MSAFLSEGDSLTLEERLKAVEEKLASAENYRIQSVVRHNSMVEQGLGGARTEVTDPSDDNHDLTQLTNKDTIPQARRCNFLHFKNRFTEQDGRYAIDVLVSGSLLEQEMHAELQFRQQRSDNAAAMAHSRSARSKDTTRKTNNLANSKTLEKAQSHEAWIQRVRLQSPAILKILSNVQGESWSYQPRTYVRPFLTLISFQSEMKKVLQDLERRWGSHLPVNYDGIVDSTSVSPGPTMSVTAPSPTDHGTDDGSVEAPVDNCPEALAAMRCYVKFVDEEIMPQSIQFKDRKASDDPKIQFSDIPYLFRTGELVYRPGGSNRSGKGDTTKHLWRCYGVRLGHAKYRPRPLDHRKYDTMQHEGGTGGQDHGRDAFVVKAFFLEYTGEEFCTVTRKFAIHPFQGERRIRSLPVYPVRFGPEDVDKYLAEAIELGEKTLKYIELKHVSYDSWTVTRTPTGEPRHDASGVEFKYHEYINSDAMVDFNEAFQACPHWKPEQIILRPGPVKQLVEADDFSILWWSGPDRAKVKAESFEVVAIRTGVSKWEQNKFISTDPLLSRMSENLAKGELTTKEHLRPEDKALIAGRVFAYIFQDRKFVQLDARHLSGPSGSGDALNMLQIPDEVKNLIQRSVQGHLLQKAAERRHGHSGRESQDFIRGKGAGLFILLHGVPGVGKTATAEAIAQTYGKPLFKITCGDLGLTPQQVETSLGRIFRLADSWDCILLMDEIDTFFSQRSKGDAAVTKNALVSVFLRILDYYTGILFMTTNRVGALDEAFRSRIHYSLLYPPLDRQQVKEIWRMNLRRLERIDAEHQRKAGREPMEIPFEEIMHFAEQQIINNNSGTRRGGEAATVQAQWWNGRQIRNAFQVARSLAYADAVVEADRLRASGSTKTPPPPKLTVEHFEIMNRVTAEFDDYMKEVFSGQTTADLARETEHRADRFAPERHGWITTANVMSTMTAGGGSRGGFDEGRMHRIPPRSPGGYHVEGSRDSNFGIELNDGGGGAGGFGRSPNKRGTMFRPGSRNRDGSSSRQTPLARQPPQYQGQGPPRSLSPRGAAVVGFPPPPPLHSSPTTPNPLPGQLMDDEPGYHHRPPPYGSSPNLGRNQQVPRIVADDIDDREEEDDVEDHNARGGWPLQPAPVSAGANRRQFANNIMGGNAPGNRSVGRPSKHFAQEDSRGGSARVAASRSHVHVVNQYDYDESEFYEQERHEEAYVDTKNGHGKRERASW